MKKGCLIVFCIVALLLVISVAVAGIQFNNTYGLAISEEVSHATLANAQTRVRAVVKLDKLRDLLLTMLPPEVQTQMPAWLPYTKEELAEEVLPREVALLAGPNYSKNEYEITLFANERRGGPYITKVVNESKVFDQVQIVKWSPDLAILRQRGVITASGSIPMPEDTEMLVLEKWTHDAPEQPLEIEGDHLVEAVFDNRNGDAMALFNVFYSQQVPDWREKTDPAINMAVGMLPLLYTIRLEADLKGEDEALVRLLIHGAEDLKSQLNFIANGIVLPRLKHDLKQQQGLILDGEFVWDDAQSMAVGEFTITGIKALLDKNIPARREAAAPAPA